jgi:hypothetical protein
VPAAEVGAGHVGAGHGGDGDQGAEDAGDEQPGRDGEDDGQRVHPDGAAEHQRLQDVPLELHDRDHDRQRDEGGEGALGHQRHEHGDRPGEERPDDRDERAEEHQGGQRDHQRHTEDRQADADADRVDECHGHRRPHVGDQRAPGAAGRLVDVGAGVAREEPDQPEPDRPAVLEEEEQGEQRQGDAGEDLADRRRRREGAGRERVLVVDQRLLQRLDGGLQLTAGDRKGADDERLHPCDALGDLLGEIAEPRGDLLHHQRDDPGDDAQPDEEHRDGGERPRPALPDQGRGAGLQQRGQEQGDDDGNDDDGDVRGGPEQRVEAGDDHEQPPRPRGRRPESVGHAGLGRRPPVAAHQPTVALARAVWPASPRRTADADGAVDVGGPGFGAAQRRPGRAVAALAVRRLRLRLVVVEDDLLIVGPFRPGVRIVLGGQPDALAGARDQVRGPSQHRAPPDSSRGRT